MSNKVIIIGGGLAGLTAANFAANADCEVTLLEKSHLVGGRATTTNKNGVLFNLGPHALYRSGQAYQILSELGIEFSGAVPKVNGSLAIKDGKKHILPAGFQTLLKTSLLDFRAKFEAARMLATLPKIDPAMFDHATVREFLEKEIRNPDARQLVQAFFRVGTYAHDPERQSAGAALAQFQMALKSSVVYLDGGWQTLIDGLRSNAEQAGVKIITEVRAAKVERDQSGGVTGVRLADGNFLPASSVIIAASPNEVSGLIEGVEKTLLGEWTRKTIPVKAACLDIALKSLPKPENNFALGIDQPLYLSVHSATAKLAPTGNAVIHVAKYLGSENPADPKAIEHELEELLDLVQPGWQALVIERRFMPSLTVNHDLAAAEHGGLSGRAGVEVPDIKGLFLAGDWIGAEGWLADASAASAKLAAESAIKQTREIASAKAAA